MRSNKDMAHFFHLLFGAFLWFVTALFMIGIAGTTIVLIITGWEDIKTIAGHEESTPTKHSQSTFRAQLSR